LQIWIGGQLELAPSQAAKVALFLAAINTQPDEPAKIVAQENAWGALHVAQLP
jgi:hypothetical protein